MGVGTLPADPRNPETYPLKREKERERERGNDTRRNPNPPDFSNTNAYTLVYINTPIDINK